MSIGRWRPRNAKPESLHLGWPNKRVQPTGWIGAILAAGSSKHAFLIYECRTYQPAADAPGVRHPWQRSRQTDSLGWQARFSNTHGASLRRAGARGAGVVRWPVVLLARCAEDDRMLGVIPTERRVVPAWYHTGVVGAKWSASRTWSTGSPNISFQPTASRARSFAF